MNENAGSCCETSSDEEQTFSVHVINHTPSTSLTAPSNCIPKSRHLSGNSASHNIELDVDAENNHGDAVISITEQHMENVMANRVCSIQSLNSSSKEFYNSSALRTTNIEKCENLKDEAFSLGALNVNISTSSDNLQTDLHCGNTPRNLFSPNSFQEEKDYNVKNINQNINEDDLTANVNINQEQTKQPSYSVSLPTTQSHNWYKNHDTADTAWQQKKSYISNMPLRSPKVKLTRYSGTNEVLEKFASNHLNDFISSNKSYSLGTTINTNSDVESNKNNFTTLNETLNFKKAFSFEELQNNFKENGEQGVKVEDSQDCSSNTILSNTTELYKLVHFKTNTIKKLEEQISKLENELQKVNAENDLLSQRLRVTVDAFKRPSPLTVISHVNAVTASVTKTSTAVQTLPCEIYYHNEQYNKSHRDDLFKHQSNNNGAKQYSQNKFHNTLKDNYEQMSVDDIPHEVEHTSVSTCSYCSGSVSGVNHDFRQMSNTTKKLESHSSEAFKNLRSNCHIPDCPFNQSAGYNSPSLRSNQSEFSCKSTISTSTIQENSAKKSKISTVHPMLSLIEIRRNKLLGIDKAKSSTEPLRNTDKSLTHLINNAKGSLKIKPKSNNVNFQNIKNDHLNSNGNNNNQNLSNNFPTCKFCVDLTDSQINSSQNGFKFNSCVESKFINSVQFLAPTTQICQYCRTKASNKTTSDTVKQPLKPFYNGINEQQSFSAQSEKYKNSYLNENYGGVRNDDKNILQNSLPSNYIIDDGLHDTVRQLIKESSIALKQDSANHQTQFQRSINSINNMDMQPKHHGYTMEINTTDTH